MNRCLGKVPRYKTFREQFGERLHQLTCSETLHPSEKRTVPENRQLVQEEAMSSFRLSSQRKHSEHKAQVEPGSVCGAQNRWWETVNYLDSSFRGWAASSGPNLRPGEELRDSHRQHHRCKIWASRVVSSQFSYSWFIQEEVKRDKRKDRGTKYSWVKICHKKLIMSEQMDQRVGSKTETIIPGLKAHFSAAAQHFNRSSVRNVYEHSLSLFISEPTFRRERTSAELCYIMGQKPLFLYWILVLCFKIRFLWKPELVLGASGSCHPVISTQRPTEVLHREKNKTLALRLAFLLNNNIYFFLLSQLSSITTIMMKMVFGSFNFTWRSVHTSQGGKHRWSESYLSGVVTLFTAGVESLGHMTQKLWGKKATIFIVNDKKMFSPEYRCNFLLRKQKIENWKKNGKLDSVFNNRHIFAGQVS